MNPCPCGNLLSFNRECRCQDREIKKYKNRLSSPFLDRIDIYIQMSENEVDAKSSIDSKNMQKIVFEVFKRQKERGQKHFNGKLSIKEINKFCILDDESEKILQKAQERFSFSHRSIQKVKKIARTVADIDGSENIKKSHILEAISYRKI